MEYEYKIENILKGLKQIKIYYSLGFLTDKEYYKVRHRMLDSIIRDTEEEQKEVENEINKLYI